MYNVTFTESGNKNCANWVYTMTDTSTGFENCTTTRTAYLIDPNSGNVISQKSFASGENSVSFDNVPLIDGIGQLQRSLAYGGTNNTNNQPINESANKIGVLACATT